MLATDVALSIATLQLNCSNQYTTRSKQLPEAVINASLFLAILDFVVKENGT